MGNLYKAYCSKMRRRFYGPLVASYTAILYRRFLESCVDGATILDIGIGSGEALCLSADIIKKGNLYIVGIDICEDSLAECEDNLKSYGLGEHVQVGLREDVLHEGSPPFDYAFLSNSYSVIRDIQSVIDLAFKMTKDSQCTISLALYEKPSRFRSFVKRNLNRVLGFDCGRYITHTDLASELTHMKAFVVDKNYTCSNKVMGVNVADLFTLLIEKTPIYEDSGPSSLVGPIELEEDEPAPVPTHANNTDSAKGVPEGNRT